MSQDPVVASSDAGSTAERLRALLRIDLSPGHLYPSVPRLILATMVSLGGSLGLDAVLVAVGTRLFPATKGYVHFRFSDYGKLTIVGVVLACCAWPAVTRLFSAPRWIFLRMAVLVTVVLWLPDLYILANGQPAKAVVVLMTMHLAIALATYHALVHIAPVREARHRQKEPEGA